MTPLWLVFLLATGALAQEYPDDYDYTEDEYTTFDDYPIPEEPPSFTAAPQEFTVQVNDEITFPCDVENQGEQVLMFKHVLPNGEHRLLFVGEIAMPIPIKLRPSSRVRKEGNSFVLSPVLRKSAGDYVCRIESSPVIELVHKLDVKYPATVERVSEAVQSVPAGDSVVLECRAEGNPQPAISWSRKKGRLPSGEQAVEGSSITLEQVTRHVEGTYVCTAANGVGDAALATMEVQVQYKPEVSTEQALLHTGEGYEAKLTCVVHGRPTPEVTWSRSGQELAQDPRYNRHDTQHRHTLTVSRVTHEDFGEYTCTAGNELGRANSTLMLTGRAKQPRVTSSPAGGEKTSYTLTWSTETFSPIIRYRLQYRKAKANMSSPDPGSWDVQNFTPEGGEDMVDGPSGHHMNHPITNLDPATDYETKIAVENKFGWSDDSQVFRFYTRKEVAVGQSASGGVALGGSTLLLMALAALVS